MTKTLLIILDGWGLGSTSKSNAIYSTNTPHWDTLWNSFPHSKLQASGENVGLPDGQMGNSEVGHLNIGAGRIVYQDLVKINKAIQTGSILQNKEIISAFSQAQNSNSKLHIMGLTSDGGVHSSLQHLFALLKIAKQYNLQDKTFVHCFMDGRDTDPKSGKGFIEQVQQKCTENGAKIASIQGRFYAMDRDKRWDRIKTAYDCLVHGIGKKSANMLQAMQESYNEGITDEFIKPIIHTKTENNIEIPIATIKENDVVIFFNFRNDRAREITTVLTQENKENEGMKIIPNLHFYCMTPYESSFTGLHILFPKENVQNTLGEIVSKKGLRQLRIAETEKFAHVTFFFSGGRDEPFENEDRVLIPSPKVATYDLQPQMSAPEVTLELCKQLDKQTFDFITLNFANGDMVGHTGVYNSIQQAVVTIDICLNNVVQCAQKNNYAIVIIADHGNADHAINDDGTPNTAHSLNPVPFIFIPTKKMQKEKKFICLDGILADVAPTICKIMNIEQPAEMTGKILINELS